MVSSLSTDKHVLFVIKNNGGIWREILEVVGQNQWRGQACLKGAEEMPNS